MSIVIETRRWDPFTAATSAALGMYFNMMNDAVGIVTKPIDEYKQFKEQKQYPPRSSMVVPDQSSQNSRDSLQQDGSKSGGQLAATSKSHTAGAMAAASAKSLGNVIGRPYKSIFVDVPLAVADGLYAVPKLYGSEVRERDKITDFKSGTIVAGKSFVCGIADGLADLVIEPYRGGKKEGALGFAKGVGKGSLGFLVKTGAGRGIVPISEVKSANIFI